MTPETDSGEEDFRLCGNCFERVGPDNFEYIEDGDRMKVDCPECGETTYKKGWSLRAEEWAENEGPKDRESAIIEERKAQIRGFEATNFMLDDREVQ